MEHEETRMKTNKHAQATASYVREFFPCNFEVNLRQPDFYHKLWRIEVTDSITHRAAASEQILSAILDICAMADIAASLMSCIKAGPTQLPEQPDSQTYVEPRKFIGRANVFPFQKKSRSS